MDLRSFLASGRVNLLASSLIKWYVSLHYTQRNPVALFSLIFVWCLENGFSWIGQYGSLSLSQETPNWVSSLVLK